MQSNLVHTLLDDGRDELIYRIGYDEATVNAVAREIIQWWQGHGFDLTLESHEQVDYDPDYMHYRKTILHGDGLEIEIFLACIGNGGAVTCTLDPKHRPLAVMYKLTFADSYTPPTNNFPPFASTLGCRNQFPIPDATWLETLRMMLHRLI